MIFFTSDLHIGHDKDFIWKVRGFSSIEEHNKEILKRWNSIVSSDDTIYILGDLCLGCNEKEWNDIYLNLHGNKKFIIGNHDTQNRINHYINKYYMENLGLAQIFRYNKKWKFYLSHYPTYTANFDDNKKPPLINLYGHTHQKTNFFNDNCYMYHVGMDSHNCFPVSIDTIIKDITIKKREIVN